MEEQDFFEDSGSIYDIEIQSPPTMSEPMDAISEKMINPSIIRYSEYLMHQLAYPRAIGLAYVNKYIVEVGANVEGTYIKRVRN